MSNPSTLWKLIIQLIVLIFMPSQKEDPSRHKRTVLACVKSTNVQIFFLHLNLPTPWKSWSFEVSDPPKSVSLFRIQFQLGFPQLNHQLALRPSWKTGLSKQTKLLWRLRAIPDSSWSHGTKKISSGGFFSRMKNGMIWSAPTSRVSLKLLLYPLMLCQITTQMAFQKSTPRPPLLQCVGNAYLYEHQIHNLGKLPSNRINCLSSLWKYQATKLL